MASFTAALAVNAASNPVAQHLLDNLKQEAEKKGFQLAKKYGP
jgi:hypothetical protein